MGGVTIPVASMHLNPPEQGPGLLQQYAQMMGIQNAQQEGQIRAAQLQQQQDAVKQTQALNDAVRKNTDESGKTNHDGVMRDLAAGGNGKDLLTYRTNLASANKTQLEAEEQRVKTLGIKLDTAAKYVAGANSQHDWDIAKQHVAQELDPTIAEQMGDFSPENKTRIIQMGMSAKDHSDYALKLIQDQRAKEEHDAKLPGEKVDSEIKQIELEQMKQFGGMTAATAAAKYRFIQKKANLGQQLSPDEQAYSKAYEKEKELNTQVRVNAMGQQREYPVYDTKTKTTLMLNPDTINRANLEEPGRYTVPNYSTEAQVQKKTGEAFAPGGKGGEEVLAFNTSLAHADLLQKAATALKNGDTRGLNSLRNEFKTQFGSADVTNFQTIANAYSREVTKALSAGHLTDSEISQQGATLPANAGPEQLMGTIAAYKNLMASKVKLRKEQFEQGKQGKTGLESGAAAGTTRIKASDGSLHDIPTANLDKAKKIDPGLQVQQ